MLTRRDFLKGLLTTLAATAINRNGVLRPSEELETPTRTIFDMAQNTWRGTYRDQILSLAPVAYWAGDGTVYRFSEEYPFLVFPSVGGLVYFSEAGTSQPLGIVLSVSTDAKGEINNVD